MNRDKQNMDEILKRSWASASREQVETASRRVLTNLRSNIDTPERATENSRENFTWRFRMVTIGAVAAALIAAFIGGVVVRRQSNAVAVVDAPDGSRYILKLGQIVHSNGGAGTVLSLSEGSRIEMRSESELSLEPAADGLRIRLNSGAVIVNAAKQRTGHLYVQTKDVSVSVVGTVFLVNAEKEGSRVAVIEGEVHVQHGATERKLQPGEQVATNPLMESQLLSEEIAWSRNAGSHRALLQQAPPVPAAPARLRFAVVSLKPVPGLSGPLDGATLTQAGITLGFGCHGVDGIQRAILGGGGVLQIPQGRCVGYGVTVALLMNYAYASPWRFGSGIPAWAHTNSDDDQAEFQIDAAAEDPSTVTTSQLREMLQTMLADRFKLKIHRETQEVHTFAIHIAKKPPNLKEASGDMELPRMAPGVGLKGKSTLDELARFLTQFVIAFNNLGYLDSPIVNKTGLTGMYEYEFRLSRMRGGGARGADPAQGPPPRSVRLDAIMAAVSDGMEDQMGLRLEVEKAPAEIIILDRVEKPTPN